MLDSIAQTLTLLHHQYLEQFLAALLPMIVTVVIHGQGMGLAVRAYKKSTSRGHGNKRNAPGIVVLIAMVGIMLATHYVEAVAWSAFYFLTGMLADFRTAMYFSVDSYTTLGSSNISLQGRWQGLEGFEAMTAMLMFGWSTALLASAIQRLHSLDD